MTRQLTIAALKAELAGRDQALLNLQAQVRALEKLNAALRAEIDVRENVEEAYRSQAIRLHEQADLLDLAPDAILVRDWGSRIRFWNAGAAEIYGWTAAEVAGRDVQALSLIHISEPTRLG